MTVYGLTVDGFVPQPASVISDGIVAKLRARFGASLPVSDDTIEGHYVQILSERLALLWELLEQIVSSTDPDKANGALLEAVCIITGTFRTAARYSVVIETLVGDDGSSIPSGSVVAATSTSKKFLTIADADIVELDAWTAATLYAIGDRRSNGGNAYRCITAGISDGAGGPTTELADITDGAAHWRFLGNGTGAVDVVCRATDTGPIVAVSGDLTTIVTPIGGLNSVINILDAVAGADQMTDEDLRKLRNKELSEPGTGPADAIRAALLKVPGVTAATVFHNDTDLTDDDGVPPHRVECLVQGGEDQAIWDCLRVNVAAGIRTYGEEEGTSTDSQGKEQPMFFTRPEEIVVYVDVTLEKDEDYPVDGDDQVKLLIATYGNAQVTGKNVVAMAIAGSFINVAPGVIGAELPLIGVVPAPVASTTIQISNRQIATFDTSRISVTTTDGIP